VSIHPRIACLSITLLLAAPIGAGARSASGPVEHPASERLTEQALADIEARTNVHLADLEAQISERLEARLEAEGQRRVASRFAHPWASPPPPVRPVRPLPARRATVLAEADAALQDAAPEAETVARDSVDQEPFGG